MRFVSIVMLLSGLLRAESAPSQLAVVGATAREIVLKWSGAGTVFTVERKSGAAWKGVAEVAAPAFTDTAIDLMGTYSYRVRAGKAPAVSGPSNEVTAGPPPIGHHLGAAVASGLEPDRFAQNPQIVLDANGDPAVAYCQGQPSKIEAMFLAWDRARYRWKAPVKIATVGDVGGNGQPIAAAYDGPSKTWLMAYRTRSDAEVMLARSTDGGTTWTTESVLTGADSDFQHVTLAAGGGRAHLAVLHKEHLLYLSGDLSKHASEWPRQTASTPGDRPLRGSFGIALDSAGQPAFAYLVKNEAGDGIEPYFWRPGSAPVLISKTPSGGPDDPAIRLTFAGTRPWIAFWGKLDEKFFSDGHVLWVAASADGGTWPAPVLVPNDGGLGYGGDLWLATGSKGQAAITATANSGNTIGSQCGTPLLARSPDRAQWKTCGPTALSDHARASAAALAFAVNDKLYMAYQSLGGETSTIPAGLVLWREP